MSSCIKLSLAKKKKKENPELTRTSGSSFLPFPEVKKQSISTLEREWDTQSTELGTSPSCGGVRSVVRTRHQPGRSLGRSSSSTVWPADKKSSASFRNQLAWRLIRDPRDELRIINEFKVFFGGSSPVQTVSSVLHPAAKSWRTTVSSHPPESCRHTETAGEFSTHMLATALLG